MLNHHLKVQPFLLIQTYGRHSSNLLQTFLNLLPTPISGADQASLILNADFLWDFHLELWCIKRSWIKDQRLIYFCNSVKNNNPRYLFLYCVAFTIYIFGTEVLIFRKLQKTIIFLLFTSVFYNLILKIITYICIYGIGFFNTVKPVSSKGLYFFSWFSKLARIGA